MIWQIFARDFYSRFLKFRNRWCHSSHFVLFHSGTLTAAILLPFPLEFDTRYTKSTSGVCYWKSAKSVGNFRQYGKPRFRKRFKMAATTQAVSPTCWITELEWESLSNRRLNSRLIMLYRFLNCDDFKSSIDFLRRSDLRTRGRDRLYQDHSNHPALHNSFFPRTIRERNKIPTSLTGAPSLDLLRLTLALPSA